MPRPIGWLHLKSGKVFCFDTPELCEWASQLFPLTLPSKGEPHIFTLAPMLHSLPVGVLHIKTLGILVLMDDAGLRRLAQAIVNKNAHVLHIECALTKTEFCTDKTVFVFKECPTFSQL